MLASSETALTKLEAQRKMHKMDSNNSYFTQIPTARSQTGTGSSLGSTESSNVNKVLPHSEHFNYSTNMRILYY